VRYTLIVLLPLALLAALPALPQETSTQRSSRARDRFPHATEESGKLSVRFDESLALKFSLDEFGIAQVRCGDVRLQLAYKGTKGLEINVEPAMTRATGWRVEGDGVEFQLHASQGDNAFDLKEEVTFESLEGARGFRRRIEVIRPEGWTAPGMFEAAPSLTFALPILYGAGRARQLVSYYGYSTVSDPGLTYDIRSYRGTDDERIWRFRSYFNAMSQSMNPGIDPELMEVVLVDVEGEDGVDLGDVIARYVEQPYDRRQLLKDHAPDRFAKEYEQAFVLSSIQKMTNGLFVRFDKSLSLRFAVDEFGIAEATIDDLTLLPRTPRTRALALNGRSAKTEVTGWRRDGDTVTLDLQVTRDDEKLRAHATVTAARIGSATGYRREVRIVRGDGWTAPPWDEPTTILTFTDPILLKGCERPKWQVRDHYGHSTVSESGTTYDVLTFRSATGQRVWLYRSYIHLVNQAINHHTEQRLVEVVLVDATDGGIDLGDVLADRVTQSHDRKALLKVYAPERFAAEYPERDTDGR